MAWLFGNSVYRRSLPEFSCGVFKATDIRTPIRAISLRPGSASILACERLLDALAASDLECRARAPESLAVSRERCKYSMPLGVFSHSLRHSLAVPVHLEYLARPCLGGSLRPQQSSSDGTRSSDISPAYIRLAFTNPLSGVRCAVRAVSRGQLLLSALRRRGYRQEHARDEDAGPALRRLDQEVGHDLGARGDEWRDGQPLRAAGVLRRCTAPRQSAPPPCSRLLPSQR